MPAVDDADPGTRGRFVAPAYNESLRRSRLVEGMFEISMLDLHAMPRERSTASLDRVLEHIQLLIDAALASGTSSSGKTT